MPVPPAHPGGGTSSGKILQFILRVAYHSLAQAAGTLRCQLRNSKSATSTKKKEKENHQVTFHGFYFQSAFIAN